MAETPKNDELITIRTAAEILTVDIDTVRRWLAKGVFPRVVRIGPSQLIRLYRSDVLAQRRENQTVQA